MTFTTIELSRRGSIALLGLNRPDKLNAINADMIDEINLALDEDMEVLPVYLGDVELTAGLRVGLSRVQALHRERDEQSSERTHLGVKNSAMNSSTGPPKVRAC